VRLAFVVQRYGVEVAGGSELHCRWHAERLARTHAVEIFTTQAVDYIEWGHGYPAGTADVNGIPVHRFPVAQRRDPVAFDAASRRVFGGPHAREDEEAWVVANGPQSPALVEAVAAARDRFDLFIFYSYRYYPTYFGLPRVAERSILVPTAEEDEAIELPIFHELFRRARGIIYLTEEERDLVEAASGGTRLRQGYGGQAGAASAVIGSGLDLPEREGAPDVLARFGLTRPFLLYLGRIDGPKGCRSLFTYFRHVLATTGTDVDLVLAGKAAMEIPAHPRIRHVGFVSEAEKVALLRASRALVMPSRYESLSIVMLEAWKLGVPVIANARCRVLLGQCRRSGGGLTYDGHEEFAEVLSLLLERPALGEALGRQGRDYVEREYAWEHVLGKLEAVFQLVRAG
jgi:glycosyltransferase involved in cell wall biosynthesis